MFMGNTLFIINSWIQLLFQQNYQAEFFKSSAFIFKSLIRQVKNLQKIAIIVLSYSFQLKPFGILVVQNVVISAKSLGAF